MVQTNFNILLGNGNNATLSDIHHCVCIKDVVEEDVHYIEHGENSWKTVLSSVIIRIILLFGSTWLDFILKLQIV